MIFEICEYELHMSIVLSFEPPSTIICSMLGYDWDATDFKVFSIVELEL